MIASYLKVAQTMHARGLIPLVHGQSSIWMIPQRIVTRLGFSQCQQLRSFVETSNPREEIIQRIDAEREKRAAYWIPFYNRINLFKTLDLEPFLRDRLLSVTIGLFHCEAKNSPLSFALGGACLRGPHSIPCRYPGNTSLMEVERCKELANQMIVSAMNARGFSSSRSQELISRIDSLYDEASRADLGQLLVIGVPQQNLSRFAYHCETGGIPSGLSAQKVLEMISQGGILKTGCQMRLLLCNETLSFESGIELVNIMDQNAVENYCPTQSDSTLIQQTFREIYEDSEAERQYQRRNCSHLGLQELQRIADRVDSVVKSFF